MLLGEPYGTNIPHRDVAAGRWLYGTPSPTHPALYGLLPNMSENSGTPKREPRSGFSRLSVSLAEPRSCLTGVLTIFGVGEIVNGIVGSGKS